MRQHPSHLQEERLRKLWRPSSSIYSSRASSSQTATRNMEREPFYDADYRTLVTLRLNQLLTRLATHLAHRNALTKELQETKQQFMDVRWEIFRIDPGQTYLGNKALDITQADSYFKLPTSECQVLEVAQGKFHSLIEKLERKLSWNQKSIDDGLELLWRILEEREKIGLSGDQRQNAGLQEGMLLDGETMPFDTTPGGFSRVEKISKLLDKCSLVELMGVQKEVFKLLEPSLGTQMTQHGLTGPVPARNTHFPPWI